MTEFAHAQGVCAMAAYQRAELFGAAHGHRLTGDLVRYTIEVLMSFNARLYGRSARNLMLSPTRGRTREGPIVSWAQLGTPRR